MRLGQGSGAGAGIDQGTILRTDRDERKQVARSLERFLAAANSTRTALGFMRDDGAGRQSTVQSASSLPSSDRSDQVVSVAAASAGTKRIRALAQALARSAVAVGEEDAPMDRWHQRCQSRRISDMWLMHALVQMQVDEWRATYGPEGPPPDAPAVLHNGVALPMGQPAFVPHGNDEQVANFLQPGVHVVPPGGLMVPVMGGGPGG